MTDRKAIINGIVIDGSGSKAYRADLLIEGDSIVEIGEFDIPKDTEVLDAKGMCVTPGFIDAHRHHDLAVLFDEEFGKAELYQGITSAVAGNCGLSPAPSSEEIFDYIEPCLGRAECSFSTVSEYIEAVKDKEKKNGLPLNIGVLAATGTISAATKGYGKRDFSPQELDKALWLIEDAMQAGALGLSCGLMYDPECFTTEADFVKMARTAAKHGASLTSHIRGEGNSLRSSVEEIIRIAQKADIPLNISHFKVTGIRNWGHGLDAAIELIEKAGNVKVDAYPYIAGSTTIMSLIPPTVSDITDLDLLKKEISREHSDWDNMVSSIGWENIGISSCRNDADRVYCGLNMQEAAEKAGLEPHELASVLIQRNSGKVGVILYSMHQDDVNRVLSLPYCSVISDSLYGGGDMPHPRLYGSFPRVIRKCVREDKLFSLETAIRKMTSMPAEKLGLEDRGIIAVGRKADILIFDSDRIKDTASFTDPKSYAEGIEKILINGKIVMDNYKLIDTVKTGKFISKKGN